METNKKIRPQLPASIMKGLHTEEEHFQNEVLRPIIKMQSDLLLLHLNAKLKTLKVDLEQLSSERKEETIAALFLKDQSYKREVVGMVIGQLNTDEFKGYLPMQKEVNRRIFQIVQQRCLDHIR